MIKLELVGVLFFTQRDESNFFSWLADIDCIGAVYGEGRSIIAEVALHPTDEDLRNLIALFFRYRLDMSLLKMFATSENEHWFSNEKMLWHSMVFGISDNR
jgi:hypothetical protein